MKSKASLDAAIRDRLDKRRDFRHGILFLAACAVLLAVFGWAGFATGGATGGGAAMCAALPFLGMAGPLRDETGGDPDGGGGDLDPVAKKILDAIKKQKADIEEVEKKVASLSETKEEAEALQKAVKDFDGLTQDVKSYTQKLAALEGKLAIVRREVSGDPVKRLSQDEEMRTLLIAGAKNAYLQKKGKGVSKELTDAAARMAAILEGKAMTGGATPGSNYLDSELITTVYQLVASYGRWAGFDVLRLSVRTATMPVDTSDPAMVWATEGAAPAEASYTGTTVPLVIKKLLGWIGVANELLEDDEIGLASHLATKFGRSTAKKLDHAAFVADGTNDAVHGDFEGIFPFGTAHALPAGIKTIAALTLDHFTGLVAGADEALVESPTTRWWIHPQMLVQLLGVKDANGRSIFLTSLEAPAAGGIGTILGYPVITTNLAPKTVGASLPFAAFGDSMGLAVAVRRDMEMASSTDAKFTEDQTVFRTRMRAGTKIKQATAFEVMTFGA
ncbi:MAG TPA: phage major capsid protein [Bacteroidia bacterium]|nr:phage major capsid protein [Bacteroidia bacterium]